MNAGHHWKGARLIRAKLLPPGSAASDARRAFGEGLIRQPSAIFTPVGHENWVFRLNPAPHTCLDFPLAAVGLAQLRQHSLDNEALASN